MPFLRFVMQPKVRRLLCWLLFLGSAGFAAALAWKGYNDAARRDGNFGHTTIDFGGQWLMGRMIVEGQGRHLYQRNYIWPIALRSYPAGVESPQAEKSDAAFLMQWLSGTDEPQTAHVITSMLSPLAASSPLTEAASLASAQTTWTEENLHHVTAPRIGGALYPPIHALYYAPLAMLRPPIAYRIVQGGVLLLALFAGWVVERMTEGRVWWPVASLLLLIFPGYSGCIALGQNGIITLTLVLLGWWQLLRGRDGLAGLCWGLLAFKPVWAAAFFLVPLMTGRWRMAASMAVTGLVQIVLTLPIVGWESWFNWLHIGQRAAHEYKRQENWIFLSRDLLGIPRRWLLTYEGGVAKDVIWRKAESLPVLEGAEENPWDHPLPSLLGWGLWALVLAGTLGTAWRCRGRRGERTGVYPAFVLSGAIFACYHFIYYDFVVAGVPVLLLFTEPRRYFQLHFWRRRSEPQPFGSGGCAPELLRYYQPSLDELTPPPMPLLPGGRQPRWVIAPAPPLLLALMLILPPIACTVDPTYHYPPWETFVLLIMWGWCGYRLLWPSRDRQGAADPPLPDSRGSGESQFHTTQFTEFAADVGRAHERLAD